MYKVPYYPGGGGYQICWERISSCDEGERGNHFCGEEYNLGGKKGRNIVYPMILRLFGSILSGEEERELTFLGRKSRF